MKFNSHWRFVKIKPYFWNNCIMKSIKDRSAAVFFYTLFIGRLDLILVLTVLIVAFSLASEWAIGASSQTGPVWFLSTSDPQSTSKRHVSFPFHSKLLAGLWSQPSYQRSSCFINENGDFACLKCLFYVVMIFALLFMLVVLYVCLMYGVFVTGKYNSAPDVYSGLSCSVHCPLSEFSVCPGRWYTSAKCCFSLASWVY